MLHDILAHIFFYMLACSANPFTLAAVRRSFKNPRCDLFMRLLEAELKHNPHLLTITAEEAEKNRPDLLFGGRRKGYYKCNALSRVELLKIFATARARGEYFAR